MGSVALRESDRWTVIPPARTRGPEAQCRALGFRMYFEQASGGSRLVAFQRSPRDGRVMHWLDERRDVGFSEMTRGAQRALDVYCKHYAYHGGKSWAP